MFDLFRHFLLSFLYLVARIIRNNKLSKETIMTSLNSTRVQAPASPVPQLNLVSLETDEPSSLNSPEREGGDRIEFRTNDKKSKLFVCKHPALFSTFNARSLSLTSRNQELLSCFSKQRIDVLSLQKHRIFHPDVELQHTQLGKNKLVTTSAWRNAQGTTIGGILLSPKATENLLTNVSDEADVDDFYSSLSRDVLNTLAHNFLIISGDFNVQVGLDNVRFSFLKPTNRNWNKLFDSRQQFQLFATNTT